MANELHQRREEQPAPLARSLARSQLCPPRRRRGPTTSPGPEMPNSAAPQRSPPESRYRYMRGPNISPGPRSRETEKKKFCELPAGSPRARGRGQSSRWRASRSPGPPAARGSGHLTGRLCALTPGRAEATAGHLLGTRFRACRSSRCSLGFSNKFQGGRRRGKKKKKRSNYANGLRTGRRALDLTRLLYEFSKQPRAGQIYAGASRLRQVPPPEHLEVN